MVALGRTVATASAERQEEYGQQNERYTCEHELFSSIVRAQHVYPRRLRSGRGVDRRRRPRLAQPIPPVFRNSGSSASMAARSAFNALSLARSLLAAWATILSLASWAAVLRATSCSSEA